MSNYNDIEDSDMEKEIDDLQSALLYPRLLYILATCAYVTRPYLLTLSANPQSAYRTISKALKNGHIRESVAKTKIASKPRNTTYYNITPSGLDYLISQAYMLPENMGWLKCIPKRTGRLILNGRKLSNDRVVRYLTTSGATVFTTMSGAEANPVFVTQAVNIGEAEDRESENVKREPKNVKPPTGTREAEREPDDESETEPTTPVRKENELEIIVTSAMQNYKSIEQNFNGTISPTSTGLYFTNSIEIKTRLTQTNQRQEEYHAGRYTGILESPLKTVLMYAGNRAGMNWTKWTLKSELPVYHAYANKFSHYHNIKATENHGVMLVENARLFADLYLDGKKKRRGEEFAEGFSSFVIIPVNRTGTEQLNAYMFTDMEQYETELVELALNSGVYKKNETGHTELFPLMDNKGTPMCIGTIIDAVRINRIRKLREVTMFEYGIICYEWQIDYYSRVLPEAKFMTIEI